MPAKGASHHQRKRVCTTLSNGAVVPDSYPVLSLRYLLDRLLRHEDVLTSEGMLPWIRFSSLHGLADIKLSNDR